jgi:N-methylhydantoinase A
VRQVWFPGSGWVETGIHQRDQLAAGTHIPGPAIVEQLDATTVVPPGAEAEIDAWRNIRIHLKEA